MIAFHLPIVPPKATSQGAGKRMMIINSKKTGKPVPLFFKNKKAESAENDLLTLCKPFAPQVPLDGPVSLKVDFVFPWRKAETKRSRAMGRLPNDVRPDCDNLVKLIGDVLTRLQFYRDDGQVADLHVTKAWGDRVGIYVSVSEIIHAGCAGYAAGERQPVRQTGKVSQLSFL